VRLLDLSIRAPGRVVLFGEHQDYLGLPVIPAAIDLYMTISGKKHENPYYRIDLPDLKKKEEFNSFNIQYLGDRDRDYLRAGVKVLQEENIIPYNKGVVAVITSDIPIQAGLSSSSALNVVWIQFLAELFGTELDPLSLTKLAHKAEVLEFQEPGGMQDHMVIAHGYLNYEEFEPIKCTRLREKLPGIVIGNSKDRKDTLNTLRTIKAAVKTGLAYLERSNVKDLKEQDITELNNSYSSLDRFSTNALKAAFTNYKITQLAYKEFLKADLNQLKIGKLLLKHHVSLREFLDVSTPKIEKLIQAATNAGALGCKITGSGNGGCMIAYCPGNEIKVKKAIELNGGEAHIAQVVPGVGTNKIRG